MASLFYNRALKEQFDGTLDLTTGMKLMLVDTNYTPDQDHDFIDNGADDATDPSFNELTATNYTAGFGGAGRKSVTLTFAEVDASNKATITIPETTWTSLGGATNDTIGGAILISENTNDTDSVVIAFVDLTSDQATNGSDVTFPPTTIDGTT